MLFLLFLVFFLFPTAGFSDTRAIGVFVTKDVKSTIRVSIFSDVKEENKTNLTLKESLPVFRNAKGWGSSVVVGIRVRGVSLSEYMPLLDELTKNHILDLAFVEGSERDHIHNNIIKMIDDKQIDTKKPEAKNGLRRRRDNHP